MSIIRGRKILSVKPYAITTKITTQQSKIDIETLVKRYGGTGFGYLSDGDNVHIMFRIENRNVKIFLPLPNEARQSQLCKARWRSLFLVVKAKLEAVNTGIATIEEEFLANIVVQTGETVYERYKADVAATYIDGAIPLKIEGK
jgi:hypothetical protein